MILLLTTLLNNAILLMNNEGTLTGGGEGDEHPQVDSHRPQRAAGNRQGRYAEASPAAGQSPDA